MTFSIKKIALNGHFLIAPIIKNNYGEKLTEHIYGKKNDVEYFIRFNWTQELLTGTKAPN